MTTPESQGFPERPELDDTVLNDWFIVFQYHTGEDDLESWYIKNSQIIPLIDAELAPMLSALPGAAQLSIKLSDTTQKHALTKAFDILLTASEQAGLPFRNIWGAQMADEASVIEALESGNPFPLNDVSLQAIDIERELQAIRDTRE